MDTKSFLTSRTLWGGVALAVAFGVAKWGGVEPTAGEQAEGVDKVIGAVDAIIALVGFVLVWVGRVKATKRVAILPGK